MPSSNCHTVFPDESEFLDAELHLSGLSANLFDSILEDGEGRLFESRGSSDLDAMLSNSRGSAAMDLLSISRGSAAMDLLSISRGSAAMDLLSISRGSAAMEFQDIENLEGSLINMRVDAIQNKESRMSSYSGRRSRRDRSPSPQACGRFRMNEVSFDPPVQQHHQQTSHSDMLISSYATAQTSPMPNNNQRQQPHRQTSQGDLSMSSYATAPTSPMHMPNNDNNQRQPVSEHSEGGQCSKAQYNEALGKLADSMKRTEGSRRHVMMQRNMLTPAQQHAISSAKEQLQRQVVTVTPHDGQGSMRSLSPGRSSTMDAFFSGSRGTLTNGLDQSRRQLSLYMGQRLGK